MFKEKQSSRKIIDAFDLWAITLVLVCINTKVQSLTTNCDFTLCH